MEEYQLHSLVGDLIDAYVWGCRQPREGGHKSSECGMSYVTDDEMILDAFACV